jgi:hypothetical protein
VAIDGRTWQQLLKRVSLVAVFCFILVSAVIMVDVVSGEHEFQISQPSFSHDFPDTVYFYNTSGGVTFNTFSIIFNIPANHSGQHHIMPREVSLIFWFRDNNISVDNLSSFVNYVRYIWLMNSTFSFYDRWNYNISASKDGWWAPCRILFVVNEEPYVNSVDLGCAFELILINSCGHSFDGHELSVRMAMNVTYSRWWYSLRIAQSHQVASYVFNLPESGTVLIESLELGVP